MEDLELINMTNSKSSLKIHTKNMLFPYRFGVYSSFNQMKIVK